MCQNFETCYSTVPPLEQYGHVLKKNFIQLFLSPLNIVFNFFSLFSQIQPVFSLSLSSSNQIPSPSLTLTDQAAAIASGLKTPSSLI